MTATTWMAELTLATAEPLTEDYLVHLDQLAGEHDWSIASRAAGPGAELTAWRAASEPDTALAAVLGEVRTWLARHEVAATLVGVQVRSEADFEREVTAPTIPELLATTDVAEVLGVTRQRVHQLWADNPQFPQPVVRTGAGPLWTRQAVTWFASVWDRRPGRRPRSVAAS